MKDGIGRTAFYALAFAETVVCYDFDEDWLEGVVDKLALTYQIEDLDLLSNGEV